MLKPLKRKKIFDDFIRFKKEGYVTILLSASPDIYLQSIKELFGFDILISTKVEIINNIATGKIIGENCKGIEKLRRLREILSEDEIRNAVSYADSESDRFLMQIVKKPIWV
jgi:phosphatidylglycerophosphatase C